MKKPGTKVDPETAAKEAGWTCAIEYSNGSGMVFVRDHMDSFMEFHTKLTGKKAWSELWVIYAAGLIVVATKKAKKK